MNDIEKPGNGWWLAAIVTTPLLASPLQRHAFDIEALKRIKEGYAYSFVASSVVTTVGVLLQLVTTVSPLVAIVPAVLAWWWLLQALGMQIFIIPQKRRLTAGK